ncbi:MAG: hypothetical protein KC486_06780 [Myxococcales bacterium]|nr:hypothetical protein [Myxococcales bacterium]
MSTTSLTTDATTDTTTTFTATDETTTSDERTEAASGTGRDIIVSRDDKDKD